jgi:N-hydroxyarylamine O-acetyltransferase
MTEWEVERLDVDRYLRRVGYDGDRSPTADTLHRLHRAHVAAIPFENLDVVLGRGVSVELADVEAKLVRRSRGGYCYEHGLLFAAVLERLGFTVARMLGRVGGEELERPRARTHMALRVRAGDAWWLADVGFGSGLLAPIRLADGARVRQGGWEFGVRSRGDGRWVLDERRGEWATLYSVDEQRLYPADVVMSNHFTSTHPRSPFVQRAVAVRKDEHALHELIDRRLTTTFPDRSVEERELSGAEFADALVNRFGVALEPDELARLEPALPPAG